MSQNLSRRQLLRAGLAGSATLAAAAVHAAPAGLYKPGTYPILPRLPASPVMSASA